jgi:cytochrome c-type biogenesis protein CcmH/NrfF
MPKRAFHLAALVLAALTMLGAGSSTTTLDRIGHKLVCQCGCGEILMECNHVGCPVSGPMIEELRTQLAAGQAEPAILNAFIAKYGPIVLAAPIRGGFDIVAWVVPFAVLFAGAIAILFVLRHWRARQTHNEQTHPPLSPTQTETLRNRIRTETNDPE